MYFVYTAVNWLCSILIYMLLGRAILSWFVNPYTANPNSFLYKLYGVLTQLTEPLVRVARNFTSRFNTGPMDFSILAAMFAVVAIRFVLTGILRLLMI